MRADSAVRSLREQRRTRLLRLAERQGGVLSRPQLYAAGTTRWVVEAELRAGRWAAAGRQVVVLDPTGVPDLRTWWTALLAVAPRADVACRPRCALDGLTALAAAGLEGVSGDGRVHVAAPKSSHPFPAGPGVRVHETRRWRDDDVLLAPVPRIRPPVAAVHAALWARTPREAALLLVAPVQQRLTTAAAVAEALDQVRRHQWLRTLRAVVQDAAEGAHSLGELDLARLCRLHGLPEPRRQVVRHGARGRVYLDVRWDGFGVVVEVDGIHHAAAAQQLDDAIRQNEEVLRGSTVLRMPSLALRLEPERCMAQLVAALQRAGWTGTARRPSSASVRAVVGAAPQSGGRSARRTTLRPKR